MKGIYMLKELTEITIMNSNSNPLNLTEVKKREQNTEIARAYSSVIGPWAKKEIEPPPVSVKEVARKAGIKDPATLANQLANGGIYFESNGSLNSKLVLVDDNGYVVENIEAAARKAAPFKRAINQADYRSKAPGGGPVVKRRVNEKSLDKKLVQLGKGRLRIQVEKYDEENNRQLSREETKQRIAQRWVNREIFTISDVRKRQDILSHLNLTPSAVNEFIKVRNLNGIRKELGFGKERYSASEYISVIEAESKQRARLASEVNRGLTARFNKVELGNFDSVVGIPVVGFANQSPIFERTLTQLSEIKGRNLFILLVNYPDDVKEDDTADRLARLAKGSSSVITLNEVVEKPIMMGDIRSAIFDGYITASGLLSQEQLENKSFCILDDDFLDIPQDWLIKSKVILADNSSLAVVIPNVKFESPQFEQIPEGYKASERLRQSIAFNILKSISGNYRNDGQSSERTERIFGRSIEGFCYSGMVVRASDYMKVGGFPPNNEITGLVRLITYNGLQEGDLNLAFADDLTLITDARRAIASYMKDGLTTVKQWQAYKFQVEKVDPVRTGEALLNGRMRSNSKDIDEALSQVLEFFGIKSRRDVSMYLDKLDI